MVGQKKVARETKGKTDRCNALADLLTEVEAYTLSDTGQCEGRGSSRCSGRHACRRGGRDRKQTVADVKAEALVDDLVKQ